MKIKCIACLENTRFTDDTPFELREMTYLQGLGQLCDQCYRKVEAHKKTVDTELIRIRDEKAERWRLIPLDPTEWPVNMACPICFELRAAVGRFLDDIIYHCEACPKFFRKEDAP